WGFWLLRQRMGTGDGKKSVHRLRGFILPHQRASGWVLQMAEQPGFVQLHKQRAGQYRQAIILADVGMPQEFGVLYRDENRLRVCIKYAEKVPAAPADGAGTFAAGDVQRAVPTVTTSLQKAAEMPVRG